MKFIDSEPLLLIWQVWLILGPMVPSVTPGAIANNPIDNAPEAIPDNSVDTGSPPGDSASTTAVNLVEPAVQEDMLLRGAGGTEAVKQCVAP